MKEMWQDAHKLFLKSTDDLRVCRTINKELVDALEHAEIYIGIFVKKLGGDVKKDEPTLQMIKRALTRAKELSK